MVDHRDKRNWPVHLMLYGGTHGKLKGMADRMGLTIPEVIEIIIAEYFDRQD